MKRFCMLLFGTLCSMGAFAQVTVPAVDIPKLPKQAASADGFVPKGWKIEAQSKGDLNGDGLDDLVLVLRDQSPENIIVHDGMGESPFDSNPRILAVAFAHASGPYTLAVQSSNLIPRRDNPVLDDPFDADGGVSIQRGSLRVHLHFWASAGTWTMSSTALTFRWQNQHFELIGYDENSTQRNSGSTSGISVNYLTGKVKMTEGNMENDAVKTTWSKLASPARWTIDSLGDGMAFDPLKGAGGSK
jgi:hypothetical protein